MPLQRIAWAVVALVLLCPKTSFAARVSVYLYSDSGLAITEGTIRVYKADAYGLISGSAVRTVSRRARDGEDAFHVRLEEGHYVVEASLVGFVVTRLPIRVASDPLTVRLSLRLGDIANYDGLRLRFKNGRLYAGDDERLLRNFKGRALLEGTVLRAPSGKQVWIRLEPFLPGASGDPFDPLTATIDDTGRFDFGYVDVALYFVHVMADSNKELGTPDLLHTELFFVAGDYLTLDLE